MIFQWSDGWWKYMQDENLDVHDTTASWATNAYSEDFVEGQNNMNEEWWGITAKNPPDARGFYTVNPRTAYWVLREAFTLDPYANQTSRDVIEQHFGAIAVSEFSGRYATTQALSAVEQLSWARVSNVRMLFDSSVANGDSNTTRGREDQSQFGTTGSFWVDFELNPSNTKLNQVDVVLLGR